MKIRQFAAKVCLGRETGLGIKTLRSVPGVLLADAVQGGGLGIPDQISDRKGGNGVRVCVPVGGSLL